MPKAYWIVTYREIRDAQALAAYAKLAGPAVAAVGGRFLARGLPGAVREAGQMERVVLVEYPSLEVAVNFYEGPAYQAALAALGRDAVVRDIRIVEAAE